MHSVVYVIIYGVIFASLYGIMTVGLLADLRPRGLLRHHPARLSDGRRLRDREARVPTSASHWIAHSRGRSAWGFLCLVHYLVFIRPQRDNPYRVFFATILLALGVESVMAVIYSAGYSYKIAPLIPGKVDLLTVSVERQLLLGRSDRLGRSVRAAVLHVAHQHGTRHHRHPAERQRQPGHRSRRRQDPDARLLCRRPPAWRRRVLLRRVHRRQRAHVGLPDDHHVHHHDAWVALGSIKGIMYATLLIGVLEVGVVTFIDPRIRAFVLLGVAVAILIYRPRGIAGIRIG